MLTEGDRFPDFALLNQDGVRRRLSDYAGKWLVLYVYPKDDTPGCTLQGKSFTAAHEEFERAGVEVVGISQDDVASHRSFCDKHGLAVELLADPHASLLDKMGVPKGEWNGIPFWTRTTFLIDGAGVIRKTYGHVDPQGHERVLLGDIESMQAS
jgi:thioredoxin-dependent peroxiredoxin